MHRIYLAFLCFFRILFGQKLPAEVTALPPADLTDKAPLELPPRPQPVKARPEVARKKPDASPGALQLLALLQREGRLVDFLSEDISAYDDAAIGAAVRDIHKGCAKVLREHFGVEPIIVGEENEDITVDTGFDPARIRLVGNVTGSGPFKGTLRHHGWRAAKVTLPTLAEGVDTAVVAPAEVELS
jgi:Domain of unknown function (DUF2760)